MLTDHGKLYTWGADYKGQLGLGCAPTAIKALLRLYYGYIKGAFIYP
jgi:hypothetical protein